MPIDPLQALGASAAPVTMSWQPRDVIIYHLGLGAGYQRPTDARELAYVYERCLKVLPTFAVVPALRAVPLPNSLPGVEINLARMLAGGHELVIHKAIPACGEVTSTARVAELWDKGSNAVMVIEVESVDNEGEALFTNRLTMFMRGEGGFGGPGGPSTSVDPPARSPDHLVETPTLPHQALIYRLSGDWNPLHADPEVAVAAGFDAPILHGLCSYGIAAKAVVDEVLDGAVERVVSFKARFAGVVTPGETLLTSIWREDHRVILSMSVAGRTSVVLSNAVMELGRHAPIGAKSALAAEPRTH